MHSFPISLIFQIGQTLFAVYLHESSDQQWVSFNSELWIYPFDPYKYDSGLILSGAYGPWRALEFF